jgi:hypothetical protein
MGINSIKERRRQKFTVFRGSFQIKAPFNAKIKNGGDLSPPFLIYVLHQLSISKINIEALGVDCSGESSENLHVFQGGCIRVFTKLFQKRSFPTPRIIEHDG